MKRIFSIFLPLFLIVAGACAQSISFTASEWATSQGLSNGAAVTDFTKDGVTVRFAQGSAANAPTYNASYSAIAAAGGSSMTITVPEGKQLTQAVFTMYNATMANNLVNATWSAGEKTASGNAVTWTGEEESLTVTFSAMEGFVAFSVTFSEPPVDPSLSYNDTTVLDIPAYVAQWQEDNPWDEWPTGPADSIGFTVDDKLIIFKKGLEGGLPSYQDNSVYLSWMSTLTVTAPYKIRKIILTFAGHRVAENWLEMGNPKSSCSTGQLELGETDWERNLSIVIWTGNAAQVVFTSGYGSPLAGVTIISDTTDNQAMVTFYDFNGHIAKTEPVSIGGNATAPIIDDECFGGWDQEFTDVLADLEIHPVRRNLLYFSIDEWKELYGTWRIPQATKGDYTIFSDYYEGGGIGEDPIVIDGVTYQNRLLIYSGYQCLKAAEPFNNLTILCRYESNAANLAAATWSSGVVEQDGLYVHWTGYTDSLRWDMPDASYQICAYRIECRQLTEYTVIFYNIHGEEIKRETIARGGNATAPADMTETGYQFIGWDTSLTNLGGDNPFIEVHPVYEEVAGYVTVTFVDIDGNLIQRRRVAIGGTVSAPQAPDVPFMLFAGWDHELTNITDDVTIKAVYTIDWNNPDILTMEQWRAISPQDGNYYAVKGIITRNYSSDLEEGGTLSFAISDAVTSIDFGAEWGVYHSLYLNSAPFFHTAQIQAGDTVIVYGQIGYTRFDNSDVRGFINGYLLYHATHNDRSNIFYLEMPDAQVLYDFNGDGKKQVAATRDISTWDSSQGTGKVDYCFSLTNSFEGGFRVIDTTILSSRSIDNWYSMSSAVYNNITYIEDVNHDGKPDFTTGRDMGRTQLYLSEGEVYSLKDSAFAVTNMDINADGRMDYFILSNNSSSGAAYGQIAYQTTDGTFRLEAMKFVERHAANVPGLRRSRGIGQQISAPTRALDLNGDGLTDLIDEKDGSLYINLGNGKWEWKELGNTLMPVDLNGDGYTDFVMTGDALYTAIYNPTTQDYTITALNSNGMVDDIVYCYDFDKDGDIDLLATFSAYYNSSISYTAFFMNDGNGNFTKQNEQNYGANELWFSDCQDLDGDGYYDLLAFKGKIGTHCCLGWDCDGCNGGFDDLQGIVWLQGSANGTFAAPEKLFDSEVSSGLYCFVLTGHGDEPIPTYYRRNDMQLHIYAEDLENNGTMYLWASKGTSAHKTTEIYPFPVTTPNIRPTAPQTPQLTYNGGFLTVTWGNGADDKTATADLTYALRIGTTAGGTDILSAHANADGSRRNFLDGNMGRAHSYTIDLRSYAPSDIYVAVQTIDAQHMGSAWSEEASIAHTFVPIDFTFAKDKIIFGDTAVVHYTALPEAYSHSWKYEDGEILSDSANLTLSFPTGGEKTITHIVTLPDGQQDSVSHSLIVLPVRLEAPIEVSTYARDVDTIRNTIGYPMADFTYDGRLDGILPSTQGGVSDSKFVVVEGQTTLPLFHQSAGMWNANIMQNEYIDGSNIRWYDYDRDGNVDLLFKTRPDALAKMLHDPTQPALTARENTEFSANNSLLYILGYGYSQGTTHSYSALNNDMRHIGTPECIYRTVAGNEIDVTTQFADFKADGSVEYKDFTIIGDAAQFHNLMRYPDYVLVSDFDHDGFADIAGLGMSPNCGDCTYSELVLFYNRGNGVYEQGNIPFPEILPPGTRIMATDFNGDGYIDILASNQTNKTIPGVGYTSVYSGVIYWNNANQGFTRQELPTDGELLYFGVYQFSLSDLDNNGYVDITATVRMPSAGDKHGMYAWFMGADGLLYHGLIHEGNPIRDVYFAPDDHRINISIELPNSNLLNNLYSIVTQSDERPSAPTNIQATMTDDGLLLTWNDAIDDHTPAALMRYNLSMKAEGAETYLFSPQNGGNENAAYLPGYSYINATQFFIPSSVLSNGNYEIRLQAVDNQNKMSLFSETLVYNVARNPIEAPATTCAWDYTAISYMGADKTATPVWDFGEAVVYNGSGFGPYTVYWQSGGEKVISLTLGDTTYRDTINVYDPYELPIYPPQELYEDTPVTVSLPEGVTCAWYAKLNDDTKWCKVDGTGILLDASYFLIYDRRLKVNGNTITAYLLPDKTSLCNDKLELRFEFTTPNGCTGYYEWEVTVRPQTNIPTLTLVTTDANGHNSLSWTNVEPFNTIYVYKEGTTLNDFQYIGSAAATDGSFTDANSNATIRAERYRITGISANGSESPASTVHQTVHLTINRGVLDGSYNLIWNSYMGADVVSYNILRGATPSSLTQIATVAASNTSYTDYAPVDSQPYYAIEYMLNQPAYAPGKARRVQAAVLSGRSNVVDRNNSSVTPPDPPQPQNGITVRLYPGEWETVYLYAWTGSGETQPCGAWPGAAVSKDAQGWWSYTFDPSIQDVNIIWTNGAGLQTVDITHVTASTCYRLGEIIGHYTVSVIDCATPIDGQPKNYLPYGLQASVDGGMATLSWSVTDLPAYFGISVFCNGEALIDGTTLNNNTSFAISLERYGTYTWRVCGANEMRELITEWVYGPEFEVKDPHEGVDTTPSGSPSRGEKLIINGVLYIVFPDGKVFNAQGARVK